MSPDEIKLMTPGGEVSVRMVPCSHCGAAPSERDAIEAVTRHASSGSASCGVCGQGFRVAAGRIVHGEKEWHFVGDLGEPMVTVVLSVAGPSFSNLPSVVLHARCLTQAFPRYPWPTMLFQEAR